LKSFKLEFGKDFELACGKATLAVGRHETNALWAVVFPHEPAHIRSKKLPGDGETTEAFALRFAPAEIGRLFPAKTVSGPGDGWRRAEAGRIFTRKLGYKWFTGSGTPTVVPGGITLVDVDTDAYKRRYYVLDSGAGDLQYVPDFEGKLVPPLAPMDAEQRDEVFDEVWEAFAREYAKFELVPKLDWKKSGKRARESLERADTAFGVAAVLADMLAELQDLHVWVKAGDDWLPGYSRERPLNGSWKGSQAVVGGEIRDTEKDLVWGRSSDGIGWMNVHALGDPGLPAAFDEALDELADTWSLVIDLRFNGGGDEGLGQEIAGRFLDEERIYSTNRYRSGPAHSDLGPVLERKVAPRGPWRYESPVVVLFGQKTMSSAESLVLMLAQCPQVTTMGDRSAGSSGNPRRLELAGGIVVNLPRWNDMDPEGKPIEHVGVQPDVALEFGEGDFTDEFDPVLAIAIDKLRKAKGKHEPGKRGS
jgi:hypothetical protein